MMDRSIVEFVHNRQIKLKLAIYQWSAYEWCNLIQIERLKLKTPGFFRLQWLQTAKGKSARNSHFCCIPPFSFAFIWALESNLAIPRLVPLTYILKTAPSPGVWLFSKAQPVTSKVLPRCWAIPQNRFHEAKNASHFKCLQVGSMSSKMAARNANENKMTSLTNLCTSGKLLQSPGNDTRDLLLIGSKCFILPISTVQIVGVCQLCQDIWGS